MLLWRLTSPSCTQRVQQRSPRLIRSYSRKHREYVPSHPVRTRFAPSPTGYLHFGSLRTALYNYLLARRTGGHFILRLEDTDEKRTIPGAEERIYEDLRWAGLNWDEGPIVGGDFGPYRQSERTALYESHAQELLHKGHAYRCFCTAEDLRAKDENHLKMGWSTGYDRTCFHRSKEESEELAASGKSFVVRLIDTQEHIPFEDFIYGRIPAAQKRIGDTWDDPILLKSTGGATYHLANVVDDYHMNITHVIRGVEWLISTRKHLALYKAFGWSPPVFAHVGLLLDERGNKLSKREKSFDLSVLKEAGLLPEALNNFLALLGWSHRERKDFMSMQKLEEIFDLRLNKSNPTVSLPKLWFLSSYHAQARVSRELALTKQISPTGGNILLPDGAASSIPGSVASSDPSFAGLVLAVAGAAKRRCTAEGLASLGLDDDAALAERARQVLLKCAEKYTTAPRFVAEQPFMFTDVRPAASPDTSSDPLRKTEDAMTAAAASQDNGQGLDKLQIEESLRAALLDSNSGLLSLQDWTEENLTEQINVHLQAQVAALLPNSGDMGEPELKAAKAHINKLVWECLRNWIAWGMHGMKLVSAMEILGQEVCLRRIKNGTVR